MTRIIIIVISILMFFFKNNVSANYEKKIFDFKFQSISGEIIDLNSYRNKVILANAACLRAFSFPSFLLSHLFL